MKPLFSFGWAAIFALLAVCVVVPAEPAQAAPPYVREARYQAGFNDGFGAGYRYGYHDGREGKKYRVKIDQGRGAYLLGYADGYYQGYAAGYHDGRKRVKFYVPVIRW
jgi:hypothetical protein